MVIFWVNGSFEWARTRCSWRHTLGTEIDPGKVYLLVPSSSRLKSLSCVRWWQRKFPFRPSRRRAATLPHRCRAADTPPPRRRHAAAEPPPRRRRRTAAALSKWSGILRCNRGWWCLLTPQASVCVCARSRKLGHAWIPRAGGTKEQRGAFRCLKYGFCKKSLRKNATLNSWTLFSSQKGTCTNES